MAREASGLSSALLVLPVVGDEEMRELRCLPGYQPEEGDLVGGAILEGGLDGSRKSREHTRPCACCRASTS